jgi:hypothetical protein
MDATKSCWCALGGSGPHQPAKGRCPQTTPDDYVGRIVRAHIGGNLHHVYRVVGTVQVAAGFARDGVAVIYTMLRAVPLDGEMADGPEVTISSGDIAVCEAELGHSLRPHTDREASYDSASWPRPEVGYSPNTWAHLSFDAAGHVVPYEWPDTDGAGMIR